MHKVKAKGEEDMYRTNIAFAGIVLLIAGYQLATNEELDAAEMNVATSESERALADDGALAGNIALVDDISLAEDAVLEAGEDALTPGEEIALDFTPEDEVVHRRGDDDDDYYWVCYAKHEDCRRCKYRGRDKKKWKAEKEAMRDCKKENRRDSYECYIDDCDKKYR